jgi:hypothetical protein
VWHLTISPFTAIMHVEAKMVTISLKVSDQLAQRLTSLQDHLPEIIELGLRHWQRQEVGQSTLTPRQRVERLWAATGLIVPLDPTTVCRYPVSRTRQPAVHAGGKPASQIIIEQRRTRDCYCD